MLYEGKTHIPILVDVAKDKPAGGYSLTFALTYQVCSDEVCYPPKTNVKYTGKVTIGGGGSAPQNLQQLQSITQNNSSPQTAMPENSDEFERLLKETQNDEFTKAMGEGF